MVCLIDSLSDATSDEWNRWSQCVRIRPESRLETLYKASEVDDSAVGVTLLIDTRSNAVLDVHVTTTRKHDSKIAPSLINRNTGEVAVLLGDKGYDDQKIRALARETGVRPLIKHREFSSLHRACNARLDAGLYGQRSQNETVNSRLKRKYGAFVRSRH